MATIISTINAEAKGTETITEDRPTTNRMLKMLLPTILPMAISAFPFLAAITEVTSSGKEVPKATMVRPINRSLRPRIRAMLLAASTEKLLPRIMATKPMAVHKRHIQMD